MNGSYLHSSALDGCQSNSHFVGLFNYHIYSSTQAACCCVLQSFNGFKSVPNTRNYYTCFNLSTTVRFAISRRLLPKPSLRLVFSSVEGGGRIRGCQPSLTICQLNLNTSQTSSELTGSGKYDLNILVYHCVNLNKYKKSSGLETNVYFSNLNVTTEPSKNVIYRKCFFGVLMVVLQISICQVLPFSVRKSLSVCISITDSRMAYGNIFK